MLVAVIALSICLFLMWIFLGSVTHSLTSRGIVAHAEEHAAQGKSSVQVFIWGNAEDASGIMAGMKANVFVNMASGQINELYGRVLNVSEIPLSEHLSLQGGSTFLTVHRLDISIDDYSIELSDLADRQCQIVVELGRQSPIRIFQTR